MAASIFRLRAEGNAAHQFGPRQRCDAIVVDGENAQLVVTRRRQVAQQEVLVIGWNHPGREAETLCVCREVRDDQDERTVPDILPKPFYTF